MLDGMTMATQGMVNMSLRQDVIANNLANVGTAGFRKDDLMVSSFSKVMKHQLGKEAGFMQCGEGVDSDGALYSTNITHQAQGSLKETGNTFDLALDDNGAGFFTIQTPEGIKFSRNGSFRLSTSGYLVTQDGSFVMGHKGPIKMSGNNFTVNNEGVISVDGQEMDKLLITTFDDRKGLSKSGDNNFTASSGARVFTGFQLKQGFIEMSNVNAIKEMVDMITVMRAFEANQKVLQAQAQALQKSTSEVGRVKG